MSKAADAFRTISEVAAELEVPKHVLRFWEAKFAQIRPMKRGGGRRYYRPADMELLRGIRHLLHAEGYTIKGVQKILREQGIDHVKVHGRSEDDLPANENAAPSPATAGALRAGVETAPQTPPGKRRAAGSVAQGQSLSAIILELEDCRERLLGSLGRTAAQTRAPRRLRAARS